MWLVARSLSLMLVALCFEATIAEAQTDTSASTSTAHVTTAPATISIMERPAYGLRTGYGRMLNEAWYQSFEAFYDVPIGDILFCPEFKIYLSTPVAFLMGSRFKFGLWERPVFELYGSLSTEVGVWVDRVSIGLPVAVLADFPVSKSLQFELMATATPQVFIGVSDRSLFLGIFAGVRLPVGK